VVLVLAVVVAIVIGNNGKSGSTISAQSVPVGIVFFRDRARLTDARPAPALKVTGTAAHSRTVLSR
jgi:hypothetical protein